ncbi:hypothetical protein CCHL11_03204 [Colletotrichum chlorophyti]|uniref:Cyclochlorotine biosynthesis protein R n=1 Tax=Colletotrichum chlorophyti TaxID=708187 RepID=A0A1Q8S426_9PEZI|nr:hypothetical protein CCHL11_03204 [Colletotrichum chlorophyti]
MKPDKAFFYSRISTTSRPKEEEEDDDKSNLQYAVEKLRRRLLISYMLLTVLTSCILALALLNVKVTVACSPSEQDQVPLGADPMGYVPVEIGGPVTWKTFYNDSRDPYWMDEDTFDSMEKLKHALRRLKWLHNATNIRANGRYTRYRDWDGNENELPPYTTWTSGNEIYGIRAFHQMHCIIVMTEDYGYRLHDLHSQWTPGHVMHCLNRMRQLLQCMSDATPVSYLKNGRHGHIADGQQVRCRDYEALRHWANAPERGTRYIVTSPEGAEKEIYKEIDPFPGEAPLPEGW